MPRTLAHLKTGRRPSGRASASATTRSKFWLSHAVSRAIINGFGKGSMDDVIRPSFFLYLSGFISLHAFMFLMLFPAEDS